MTKMTPLPALTNWNATRDSLHTIAQVVGSAQKAFIDPMPNALHLALHVTANGIRTVPLRDNYDINVNFRDLHIKTRLLPEDDMPLNERTLATLHRNAQMLSGGDASDTAYDLQIDIGHAVQYAEALYRAYSALARFRARLSGFMTPLVLWPHHFDLSFLVFGGKGSSAPDEHKDPHMNFGFAPFSDTIDRPYFYAYAWPMPDGLLDDALPAPAQWHTDGWQGARLDYDAVAGEDAPETVIEAALLGIHTRFARYTGMKKL